MSGRQDSPTRESERMRRVTLALSLGTFGLVRPALPLRQHASDSRVK